MYHKGITCLRAFQCVHVCVRACAWTLECGVSRRINKKRQFCNQVESDERTGVRTASRWMAPHHSTAGFFFVLPAQESIHGLHCIHQRAINSFQINKKYHVQILSSIFDVLWGFGLGFFFLTQGLSCKLNLSVFEVSFVLDIKCTWSYLGKETSSCQPVLNKKKPVTDLTAGVLEPNPGNYGRLIRKIGYLVTPTQLVLL